MTHHICHFCHASTETEPDGNPFVYHDGVAICLNCLCLSLRRLHDWIRGEREYLSWSQPAREGTQGE